MRKFTPDSESSSHGVRGRWDVEQTEKVGDYRVFEVVAIHGRRHGDAGAHTFYRIDAPDWVNVVALTAEGQVVLIRQFRHGAAKVTLEVPGGMVDAGEAPADAAARELLEETGYAPATMRKIGEVSPNPALFGNRLHSFLAEGCVKVKEPHGDPHEDIEVELVDLDRVDALLAQGAIDHALVMCAFHWVRLDASRRARPST